MGHNIFICYRRSDFASAQLFYEKLKSAGYRVFLDTEGPHPGRFKDTLYSNIDRCRDFILVLTPGALDRCESEGDWVRKEIARALEKKKNIIPLVAADFKFPDPLPEPLQELPSYQQIKINPELIQATFTQMQRFLRTPPPSRSRHGLWSVIIAAIMLSSALGVWIATYLGPTPSQFVAMQEKIEALRIELDKIKAPRENEDETRQEAQKEFEALRKELGEIKAQRENPPPQLVAMQEEIKTLREELDGIKARRKNEDKTRQESQKETEVLRKNLANLEAQLVVARAEHKVVEVTAAMAKRKADDTTEALRKAQADIKTLEKELTEIRYRWLIEAQPKPYVKSAVEMPRNTDMAETRRRALAAESLRKANEEAAEAKRKAAVETPRKTETSVYERSVEMSD